jgi:hypothetical protein
MPVILHDMGPKVFLISGFVSLFTLSIFLFILKYISRDKYVASRWQLIATIISIFAVVNILYFTNLIPPIPLAVKDSGVFHTIERDQQGNYEVSFEKKTWKDYFNAYEYFHKVQDEPVYAYTAIFAPTHFDTSIYHEWQHRDETTNAWVTTNTILLPIVGGRDGGYRTYSMKTNLEPGMWRVNAITKRGEVIGRVRFQIVDNQSVPESVIATSTLQ